MYDPGTKTCHLLVHHFKTIGAQSREAGIVII